MTTRRFHSTSTSPGIAIGMIFRWRRRGMAIQRYWIRDEDASKEIQRFRQAVKMAREQLSRIQAKLCRIQGHEQIKIIESYRLFIQDDMLVGGTIEHIRSDHINAEWALEKTLAHLKLAFMNVQEEYLQNRRQDIDYAGQRILENLADDVEPAAPVFPDGDLIIVVHDLSPADVVNLPRSHVAGLIIETGGETSHTAIVTRALEIPALFSVKEALDQIEDGETAILDGMKGLAIVSPQAGELAQYRTIQKRYKALEQLLLQDIHLPAETRDGFSVRLEANIELIEEIPSTLQHGAEGVGLYRTEYLFLNRLDEPSEDEQYENYKQVLQAFYPRPVTIRTIDVGGDKLALGHDYEEEPNPALGMRAIRLCLRERSLFITQLKALLRAAQVGNLRILIPLISHLEELREVKKLIDEIRRDFRRRKVKVPGRVMLGAMIEVPSAALIADKIIKEVDFLSIGTNDLLQYSLAIDRSNDLVSSLFPPYHPALFRLLRTIVTACRQQKKPVSVCGELAGDPLMISVLIGMGFDSLSMNPVSIPRVKKLIRSIIRSDAAKIAHKVVDLPSTTEILSVLEAHAGEHQARNLKQRQAKKAKSTAKDSA